VVQKFYVTDREARRNFVNWYLHGGHDGEADPTHVPSSNEVSSHQ